MSRPAAPGRQFPPAGKHGYRVRDAFGKLGSRELDLDRPLYVGDTVEADGRSWRVAHICPPSLDRRRVVIVEAPSPSARPALRYVVGPDRRELRELRDFGAGLSVKVGAGLSYRGTAFRVAAVEDDGVTETAVLAEAR